MKSTIYCFLKGTIFIRKKIKAYTTKFKYKAVKMYLQGIEWYASFPFPKEWI
jgi:hypothetical protein